MGGISIVICCYNSLKLISPTLAHIASQNINSNIKCELIVVDNASSDGTADFVKTEWTKLSNENIPLKVVYEKKAGLINARIKGVKEAKHNVIVFCDDDNWLDPNYIEEAYRIMNTNKKIGACGALGYGVYETGTEPSWFTDLIRQSYALGAQGDTAEGPISKGRNYIYGAGMVIKKVLIEKIYTDFNHSNILLSGRSGNVLAAGDDSAISFFILMEGFELWFSNKLLFKHYITEKRLNVDYVLRMYEGFGVALPHLKLYTSFLYDSTGIKKKVYSTWLIHFVAQIIMTSRDALKSIFISDMKFITAMQIAALKELIRSRNQLSNKKNILTKSYPTN